MSALAGTLTTLGASVLLPYIMKLVGRKVLPSLAEKAANKVNIPAVEARHTVPEFMVVAKFARGVLPQLVHRKSVPVWADILATPGQSLEPWPHLLKKGRPAQTILESTAKSEMLSNLGTGIGAVGSGMSTALPLIMGLVGKSVAGTAKAAGSIGAAASSIPVILSKVPQAKKELYGNTPGSAVAEAVAAVGGALGKGVGTVGEAVGSGVSDISRALHVVNLQESLNDRFLKQAMDVKNLNLNPSTANLTSQLLRSQGNIQTQAARPQSQLLAKGLQ